MRYFVACTLALALTSGACSPSDDREAATGEDSTTAAVRTTADSSPYIRGIAIRGASPRFVACGTTDTLRLIDASGTMPARAASDEIDAIFTVVGGTIEGDTAVTVSRVVYASADRGECYNDWSGFDYRATGNKPGWVAEVTGSDVRLRREGDLNFSWSGVQKDSTDARLRFTAAAHDGTGALELVLEPAPCTDVIARTLSMWSARLTIDGEELRGCAVPGE